MGTVDSSRSLLGLQLQEAERLRPNIPALCPAEWLCCNGGADGVSCEEAGGGRGPGCCDCGQGREVTQNQEDRLQEWGVVAKW